MPISSFPVTALLDTNILVRLSTTNITATIPYEETR